MWLSKRKTQTRENMHRSWNCFSSEEQDWSRKEREAVREGQMRALQYLKLTQFGGPLRKITAYIKLGEKT